MLRNCSTLSSSPVLPHQNHPSHSDQPGQPKSTTCSPSVGLRVVLGNHPREAKQPKSFTVGAAGLGSSEDHAPGRLFQEITNTFTNKTEPKLTHSHFDFFRCTLGKPSLSQELQLEQPGPQERISTFALGSGADPWRMRESAFPELLCSPPAHPALRSNLTSRVCYSAGKNTSHLPGINACLGTKLFWALSSTSAVNSCTLISAAHEWVERSSG